MKFTYSTFTAGMVWLTLPVMVGLGYWEHNLLLPGSGHKLVQMLLVVLLIGWAAFWNTQGEYDRLRHLSSRDQAKTRVTAHLFTGFDVERTAPITTISSAPLEKRPRCKPAVIYSDTKHASRNTFEVIYHVTNN